MIPQSDFPKKFTVWTFCLFRWYELGMSFSFKILPFLWFNTVLFKIFKVCRKACIKFPLSSSINLILKMSFSKFCLNYDSGQKNERGAWEQRKESIFKFNHRLFVAKLASPLLTSFFLYLILWSGLLSEPQMRKRQQSNRHTHTHARALHDSHARIPQPQIINKEHASMCGPKNARALPPDGQAWPVNPFTGFSTTNGKLSKIRPEKETSWWICEGGGFFEFIS